MDYNFGHHDAYLFLEQQLGSEYAANHMLVGKNSDGYNIVLVEFEKIDCIRGYVKHRNISLFDKAHMIQ